MGPTPLDLKDPVKAGMLAWLVPGLGHFYQGRTGKGVLYATCIIGLYLVGMLLGEGKVVYWNWVNPLNDPEKFRLSFLGQFGVGLPAIPAVIQATLKYYEHAPILGGFLAEPSSNDINALHPKLGKLLEIGWLYTMMAGLLNVLAIYDAYAGPALAANESEAGHPAPKAEGRKAEAGA